MSAIGLAYSSAVRSFREKAVRHAGLGLLAALAAVIIAACHSSGDSDDSIDPRTVWTPSEIYLNVSVESADYVSAKVLVDFTKLGASPTTRLLSAGDALSACVGAVCEPLTRGGGPPPGEYTADLLYVAETPYTISLARDGNVIAPNTVVTLPVPFAILAPPAGQPVTDGQMVTVQWSLPNNARTLVSSSTHCEHEGGATSDREAILAFSPDTDRGSTIESVDEMVAGHYVVRTPLPQAPVRRCDIVLRVSQTRRGTLDSAWRHGDVFGILRRSVTLDYTPSQR